MSEPKRQKQPSVDRLSELERQAEEVRRKVADLEREADETEPIGLPPPRQGEQNQS